MNQIQHPDVEFVKKMMIKCFEEAQKETIARAKKRLGSEISDGSIHKSIVSLVKMTFKAVGADYENPKKSDCELVLQRLYKKARAMGTPSDIADHHINQLKELLVLCPD